MKHRKITGVLVDVNAGTVKQATIEANLDSYYKALDCTCIDIIVRRLGPYRFDVICDDEGLLKADPRVSATDPYGQPMFFGNLFFCHSDEDGDMIGLHPWEIGYILSRVCIIQRAWGPKNADGSRVSWKAVHHLKY